MSGSEKQPPTRRHVGPSPSAPARAPVPSLPFFRDPPFPPFFSFSPFSSAPAVSPFPRWRRSVFMGTGRALLVVTLTKMVVVASWNCHVATLMNFYAGAHASPGAGLPLSEWSGGERLIIRRDQHLGESSKLVASQLLSLPLLPFPVFFSQVAFRVFRKVLFLHK